MSLCHDAPLLECHVVRNEARNLLLQRAGQWIGNVSFA